MKIIQYIAVFILMSSQSCGEEPFDAANGKRSYVSGKVIDDEGNAITNFDVQIQSAGYLVGSTTSDELGNFKATIIENVGGVREVAISPLYNDDGITTFNLRYRFNEAQTSMSIQTGDIIIKKTARVKLEINNTNTTGISARLNYQSSSCHNIYYDNILDYDGCYEIIEQSFFPLSQSEYQVPLNSLFSITITVNGITTTYDYLINQEDYEIMLTI